MKTNLFMFIILLIALLIFITIKIVQHKASKYLQSQQFIDLSRQTDDVAEKYEQLVEVRSKITQSFNSLFSPLIEEGKISKNDENIYLCSNAIYESLKTIDGLPYFFGFSNSPVIKKAATDIRDQIVEFNKSAQELKVLREEMLNLAQESIPQWILKVYKSKLTLLLGLQIDMDLLEEIKFIYKIKNVETEHGMQITMDALLLSNFAYPQSTDFQSG